MKRNVSEVISEYNQDVAKERNKVEIINWFLRHPERRFDVVEVHQGLSDKIGVGQKSVNTYLNELVDDGVLQSRGEKRIGYELSDDILVPNKYRTLAGIRHLAAIFDVERWGVAGSIVMGTVIWFLLTIPFWFLSAVIFVSSDDTIGSIHQSEFFVLTVAMTVWLLILVLFSYILYRLHRRWRWHPIRALKNILTDTK